MVNLNKFKDILKDFEDNNIDTTQVGFYDSPEFFKVESKNASYLNNYAKFVQLQKYNESYLKMVKAKVPLIADILYDELEKDGRLGACVDISATLSRILEKEGIWNHIVFGSFTIDFPKDSPFSKRHFCTVVSNSSPVVTAPHAWVYVPPYYVVDLTAKMQPYSSGEGRYLPKIVLGKDVKPYVPKAEDLIHENVLRTLKLLRVKDPISSVCPSFNTFNNFFPAVSISADEITLRYIPVGISAPDGPFEEAVSLILNGKYGHEIYNEIIKPALKENDI